MNSDNFGVAWYHHVKNKSTIPDRSPWKSCSHILLCMQDFRIWSQLMRRRRERARGARSYRRSGRQVADTRRCLPTPAPSHNVCATEPHNWTHFWLIFKRTHRHNWNFITYKTHVLMNHEIRYATADVWRLITYCAAITVRQEWDQIFLRLV